MRRDQLEHAIRAACQIINHREVIVVGSQAILGSILEGELPAAATMSLEIDILPIADDNDETARLALGVVARLGECNPAWCELTAGGYSGWAPKAAVWGVKADEIRE